MSSRKCSPRDLRPSCWSSGQIRLQKALDGRRTGVIIIIVILLSIIIIIIIINNYFLFFFFRVGLHGSNLNPLELPEVGQVDDV